MILVEAALLVPRPEPESSDLRGFHEENGMNPFFGGAESAAVTDGKTGSAILPFGDLVALGAGGLTAAELAERVATAPALFAAAEARATGRASRAVRAAQARAVALAGGRS